VNRAGQVVGNSDTGTTTRGTLWQRGDTTAPTLSLPASVAADATSASGATVHYTVSASDDLDPAPLVTCTPASASMFPIGDTTVTCTATDASGNTAMESFVVHVRGAAEQLDNLAAAVKGVGPGTSLADKVAQARAAVTAGDNATAVSILNAFNRQVGAQTGKSIAPVAARAMIDAASLSATVLA
jgi:hypothetical protein